MRRIVIVFCLLVITSGVTAAQKTAVESAFDKNRAKYTREHFAMGEDASSGYDYLFYKNGDKVVRIRSIWSASHSSELRIQDFYFDNSVLVLVRRSTGNKRDLGALKRGRKIPLSSKEEFHFVGSRLTRWIDQGKSITEADERWTATERETLENAKAELENYSFLKEGDR